MDTPRFPDWIMNDLSIVKIYGLRRTQTLMTYPLKYFSKVDEIIANEIHQVLTEMKSKKSKCQDGLNAGLFKYRDRCLN